MKCKRNANFVVILFLETVHMCGRASFFLLTRTALTIFVIVDRQLNAIVVVVVTFLPRLPKDPFHPFPTSICIWLSPTIAVLLL